MRTVYEPAAYGMDPIRDCHWSVGIDMPDVMTLQGDHSTEFAIIGAGFTGLNAALHLARAGHRVVVLDAQSPWFGASGRNGGFCCLGGGKISDSALDRTYGSDGRKLYRRTEVAAVDYVDALTRENVMDIDRHSQGETLLAHSERAARNLPQIAKNVRANTDAIPTLYRRSDLPDLGLGRGFYGGLTTPIGFALNPQKYALGLFQLATQAGATVYGHSMVTEITPEPTGYRLTTPQGQLRAKRFIIATNGYTRETMLDALRARFLPVQSSVIVTAPIAQPDQHTAAWFSGQMAYDTRFLLHYFRLLPSGRFLFGMRGGLRYSPRSEAEIYRKIITDFHGMFPEWRHVNVDHYWSGLVALTRNLTPFVGPINGYQGGFAGFGYHGNGVAMGSYAGAILADLAMKDRTDRPYPAAFRAGPGRFPLGRYRRWLLDPIYRVASIIDI